MKCSHAILALALILAPELEAAHSLAQQPVRTAAAARYRRAPAGAVVMIELAQPVSTKTAKSGDAFSIRLAEPLVVGGRILLPAGTPGVGQVVEAAKPGFGGKGAKLVLAARSLNPPKVTVRLNALQLSAAGRGHEAAATALGLGGIGFAPLGFVGFAIHGGDVTFPAGTQATAKLASAAILPALGRAPKGRGKAAPAALQPPRPAIDLPKPPPGKGQVVFFRRKSLLGVGQWFNVREAGTALGKLTNGAYFVQTVEPGEHVYTAKTEPEFNDKLKIEVAAGETYYVEGILTKGVVIGVADLTPSSVEAFNDAAKDLKPADAPGGEDALKEDATAERK